MKLLVLENQAVVHTLDVPHHPLTIGRAPDNALILQASQISAHHALLFREAGELHIRDLGSTNGVFLNGARITSAPVRPGDTLSIGVLELQVIPREVRRSQVLQVCQVDGPIAWSVQSGLTFPEDDAVTFFIDAEGAWLDNGPTCVAIALDEVFTVAGKRYRLQPGTTSPTTTGPEIRVGYTLDVDLNATLATLNSEGRPPVEFRSEGRVALLYVLGRANGAWVDDTEVGQGVWGRGWHRQGPNNLNVLVHRVREQAGKGGYDKGFLDRRRGGLRVLVDAVRGVS